MAPTPTRPLFALAHEPDGTSFTARDNLTEILTREIHGPMDGDAEDLNSPPDTVYLIGRLAPKRALVGRIFREDDTASTDEEVEAGSSALGEEDEAEDAPPKRGLMIPSSMGLRFQVPRDLDAFTVHASWGTYHPHAGEPTSGGRPTTRYARHQHQASVRVRLSELSPGTTVPKTLEGDVKLMIDSATDGSRTLVDLALVNDWNPGDARIPTDRWLFQTQLSLDADAGAVFLPVRDVLEGFERDDSDDELDRLTLQYRDRLEFAIGRTCSVDWHQADGTRRADRLSTTWLPTVETPPTRPGNAPGVITDMRRLAEASVDELRAGLEPIASGYAAWLEGQRAIAADLPDALREVAGEALDDADGVQERLAAGIKFLLTDPDALRCFRFMNHVMADQRIHSEVVLRRGRDDGLTEAQALAAVEAEGSRMHSWRMFQLAFVLMLLPALTHPDDPKRSHPSLAQVELLFFPTGGGKTEAYLGLAAYAFAIRRLQGMVASDEGPLDGGSGVTVLMRYTLRLLTSQQFQRATTMVCAAELRRRADEQTWGSEPFRIGLWVGSSVSPKRYDEAAKQVRKATEHNSEYGLTVRQINRCPWCGTPITIQDIETDDVASRIYLYCGARRRSCPFSRGGAVAEGVPVLTVDEEIYRLAPTFVIATVDKFARLAREGEAASLFGRVSRRCERHGFVHPDYPGCSIKGDSHPAKGDHPKAFVRPATRLRPIDLIIQDELHLITGALGTTVGLFETAIDALTSWRTAEGSPAAPMIVASSATVRKAGDLALSLYGRTASMFPPQVLDASNTWFSEEVEPSRTAPGRRYVGVCASGVRMTAVEIRLAEVLMAGAQELLDRDGLTADPYLTLVGYFNSIRELAGMARYLQDDIQTGLSGGLPWSRLPRRKGSTGSLNRAELTSRASSVKVTATLDDMSVPFDPAMDSTAARAQFAAAQDAPRTPRHRYPLDAVLATSMLQVGVDVGRLGLMLMVGQPKNTAEYIQASSRVGRTSSAPGLVVTLGNWARPRDLAHYEQFRSYHETFYSQVEALSVTPYSPTAIKRGLDAVLVSAARVLDAESRDQGLSPEVGADRVDNRLSLLQRLTETITSRAERAAGAGSSTQMGDRLENRLQRWSARRKDVAADSKTLVYERFQQGKPFAALIVSPEDRDDKASVEAAPFTVPNSMREVQPEINVLISPNPERLRLRTPDGVPAWQMPTEGDDD